MGLGGIETLDQLAKVKETVVRIANDTAVLNADDKRCLKMADNCRASTSATSPWIQRTAWCASTSAPTAAPWCSKKASTAT